MGVYESLIEGGKLTLGRGAELCLVSPLLGLAEVGGCCGKFENFEKSAHVLSKSTCTPVIGIVSLRSTFSRTYNYLR